MKLYEAKIEWIMPKRFIPRVLKPEDRKKWKAYTPLIVFDGQYPCEVIKDNRSMLPMWSSVIFNEKIVGKVSYSLITYLVEEAPFEFMKKGAKFSLYEGPRLVAKGEIL